MDSSLYEVVEIDSWGKLLDWSQENKKRQEEGQEEWVFRGLRDSRWGFETSLERAIKSFGVMTSELPADKNAADYQSQKEAVHRRALKRGLGPFDAFQLESGLLRKFKRQCHHYLTILPDEENEMEWLAMMQHYGAPTRILDLTHSIFVALYFALEQAEGECAVWAFNLTDILDRVTSQLPEGEWEAVKADRNLTRKRTFNLLLRRPDPVALVCPIIPYRFNDRLVIQQGLFLCPGDITIPFEDNLAATLTAPYSAQSLRRVAGRAVPARGKLVKLVIEDESNLRRELLQNLHHMNMNSATLFPGLAGFAQSLKALMVYPQILRPR